VACTNSCAFSHSPKAAARSASRPAMQATSSRIRTARASFATAARAPQRREASLASPSRRAPCHRSPPAAARVPRRLPHACPFVAQVPDVLSTALLRAVALPRQRAVLPPPSQRPPPAARPQASQPRLRASSVRCSPSA
jgi:hypothetical protein